MYLHHKTNPVMVNRRSSTGWAAVFMFDGGLRLFYCHLYNFEQVYNFNSPKSAFPTA